MVTPLPGGQQQSTTGSLMGLSQKHQLVTAFVKATVATVAVCITLLLPLIGLLWAFWSQMLQVLLVGVILTCEGCFALYYFYVIVKECNKAPEQHAPAGYQPDEVVKQFITHLSRVQDIKHFLSAWFLDAPYDSIKLDNVKELCAYALWYKTMDEMRAAGLMPQLDNLMSALQAMHNFNIPPGYNPDLRFMSHLWDEVPHIYRPLVFYLVMELLELISWAMLAANGFKRHTVRVHKACTVVYFTKGLADKRQPQQQQQQEVTQQKKRWWRRQRQRCRQLDGLNPSQQQQHKQQQHQDDLSSIPLVLLHGVGAGLLPYVGVVFNLATTERPIICPVWKHVSMRLTKYIPTVDDGAAAVLAALEHHGVQQAAVIGHSYGTCIAARIAKQRPDVVHTLALIDPVCFAMYMPNLVKFFLYSCHVSGSLLVDGLIALLSSEIHCASNFCRNFFWTSINLWDEHLPERTLVVLSGCDILSPTLYVRDWLENHTKAKVLYHATVAHGAGLLLNLEWQQTVLQNLMQLVESPSSAAAVAVVAGRADQAGVGVCPGAAAEAAEAAAANAGADAARPQAAGHVDACTQEGSLAASSATSSSGSEQLMDLYDAAVNVGYAFDGDEFDAFDAQFGNFLALPEGLSSISSSAGTSLAEMFDAVDIDRLWEAAANATNSLVAGVVSVVKSGSDIASSYANGGGNVLHQRRRDAAAAAVEGVGQSCKGNIGAPHMDQHTMIKCQ